MMNAATAATSAPTPINTPATTSNAAPPVGRNTSSATPAMTKAIWVTTPTVVSTTMLAAACGPGTPRRAASGVRQCVRGWVLDARGCVVAAEVGDRQQRIDRFADPSDPGDADNIGPGRRGQQLAQRKSGEEHWNDVVSCY